MGVSGARMGDIGELVKEEVSRVRQEVDGIIIHAGTNDFGRGTNVCDMVGRATARAGGRGSRGWGVGGGGGWGGGGELYWSVMLPWVKEGSGEGYLVMLRECNFRMGGMMARRGWGIIAHEDIWKRRDMWRVWLADGLHLGDDGVTQYVVSVGERVNCERGRVKVWRK